MCHIMSWGGWLGGWVSVGRHVATNTRALVFRPGRRPRCYPPSSLLAMKKNKLPIFFFSPIFFRSSGVLGVGVVGGYYFVWGVGGCGGLPGTL